MMNQLELREAAASASMRIAQERTDFIKNSYPEQYWKKIETLAGMIDDATNNIENPCKYHRGIVYGL